MRPAWEREKNHIIVALEKGPCRKHARETLIFVILSAEGRFAREAGYRVEESLTSFRRLNREDILGWRVDNWEG